MASTCSDHVLIPLPRGGPVVRACVCRFPASAWRIAGCTWRLSLADGSASDHEIASRTRTERSSASIVMMRSPSSTISRE